MSTSFTRTLRSLTADSMHLSLGALAAGTGLLAAWGGWFLLARVSLFEVTEQARLEASAAAYAVEVPVAGRVVSSNLAIGREVKAGEVLVELDAQPERLQLQEESARLQGLRAQVQALRNQASAEEKARVEEQLAARVAVEQARAQEREAQAPAQFSAEEARRLAELHKQGLIADRDFQRGRSEADKQRAAADASRIVSRRIEQEQRTRDSERDTRIRKLAADITALEGQISAIGAAEARLRNEAERRVVRAPATGRLGEVKMLKTGAYVAEGDRVAAIVPAGGLRIVAQFDPPAAIGRLREGQPARMRLAGFPWTQYGSMEATVAHVADEIRDGKVRVELALGDRGRLKVEPQHGMPGSVEVEVERVTPAALVLRLAGRWLTEVREVRLAARQEGGTTAQP